MAEMYRGVVSNKTNLRLLEEEIRQTRQKIAAAESSIEDLVSKAAFTYSAAENPAIRPELVITGSAEITEKMREDLHNNARLIRYVFCCDTIEDMDSVEVAAVTDLSLGNALNDPNVFDGQALRSGKVSPVKRSQQKSAEQGHPKREKSRKRERDATMNN